MRMENRLDIEEMERLKICTSNLQLMQRHIDRLEKYALKIDDILSLESVDAHYKLGAITRITETIKEFI